MSEVNFKQRNLRFVGARSKANFFIVFRYIFYKINENETLEISFCKTAENQLYLYMPIKEDV